VYSLFKDASLVSINSQRCHYSRRSTDENSPPLLLIFFHDKGWLVPHTAIRPFSPTSSTRSHPASSRSAQAPHFEFLLFSYLLRSVHHEGRTGDFARAGLLFLFDIAFLNPSDEGGDNLQLPAMGNGRDPLHDVREALAEYILDGDFADVMAAGLGALWSLLPTKLKVPTLAEVATGVGSGEGITASTSGGMHLGTITGLEDVEEDLPLSTDMDVRSQPDQLLKLFGFLQDIIHRCTSTVELGSVDEEISTIHMLGKAVAESTIEAISSSFLENVLYPSILECSPYDGSAVAVMGALDVILANLDYGPLLSGMLAFLLDSNDEGESTIQGLGEAGSRYFEGEGRFTMKDLLLDNLRSKNSTANIAAYRLLHTVLNDHCRLATRALLSPIRVSSASPADHAPTRDVDGVANHLPAATTSLDPALQEIELYGSLLSRIDPSQTSADQANGYSSYLLDIHESMQADPCYLNGKIPLQFTAEDSADETGDLMRIGHHDRDPFHHRLNLSDPLLQSIMLSLESFFNNSPDTNVALTGAIITVCQCANRSLVGWLLYDIPSDNDPWSKHDTAPSHTQPLGPFQTRSDIPLPAIYQILRQLIRQINTYRLDINEFDRLLSERRQGLLFADHLDEAMNVMLEVDEPYMSTVPSPSPATPLGNRKARPSLAGSIKSFLTPKRNRSGAGVDSPGLGVSPGGGVVTVSMKEAAGRVSNSPFKSHYEQTSGMMLDSPVPGLGITNGLSSSSNGEGPKTPSRLKHKKSMGLGDAASMSSVGTRPAEIVEESPKQVTLSSVLDNCVILEEFLKEIVAVITVRRTLGIDQVGYV
jgi:hypothetical protein